MIKWFFSKCITTFRSGFRFLQASILHQLKGEGHVVNLREQNIVQLYDKFAQFRASQHCIHLLFKALGGEEEVVQRNKIIFKQPHQQHQVHTVSKLHKQTNILNLEQSL